MKLLLCTATIEQILCILKFDHKIAQKMIFSIDRDEGDFNNMITFIEGHSSARPAELSLTLGNILVYLHTKAGIRNLAQSS